jgi:hypothetical protein
MTVCWFNILSDGFGDSLIIIYGSNRSETANKYNGTLTKYDDPIKLILLNNFITVISYDINY